MFVIDAVIEFIFSLIVVFVSGLFYTLFYYSPARLLRTLVFKTDLETQEHDTFFAKLFWVVIDVLSWVVLLYLLSLLFA
ncbi:hypothetical protein [Desulfovibrio litoralis]|uniref:Uncharacterized protein n=1 Tax=Desulfovibrio litoralis DSM 11393 TaxID=1121455 RepID=A0A1M7T2R4_9BACT|nr:hypothetical protein [Desulfovibrio litoralis]SHN64991.1 hypothetical protein SAMN02745728_01481 [Desulfovibrio litoralis DSM 11393]